MGISWIKHDLNIKSKPEFSAILRKYGGEAGYVYWGILEYMAVQDNGRIDVKGYTYDMLADDFHVNADALKKIVDDLVLYGLISSNENKTELWSESVLEDIELYKRKARKGRKGAEARWGGKQENETDHPNDAPSICSKLIPEGYAHTSHTSDTSQDNNHSDHKDENTSQNVTVHNTFAGYFDAFSRHFFNKPYMMIDSANKRSIEQLVDKYGVASVASVMYQTMAKDRQEDEEYKVKNPMAFLTSLLKEINGEIQYPMIGEPPENIEALIDSFNHEEMESYERLLKEYDKDMLHIALQIAARYAETNLFGYARRVLEDWRMQGIRTPEKYAESIKR
jgi:DnaD/phage-associated family protein